MIGGGMILFPVIKYVIVNYTEVFSLHKETSC